MKRSSIAKVLGIFGLALLAPGAAHADPSFFKEFQTLFPELPLVQMAHGLKSPAAVPAILPGGGVNWDWDNPARSEPRKMLVDSLFKLDEEEAGRTVQYLQKFSDYNEAHSINMALAPLNNAALLAFQMRELQWQRLQRVQQLFVKGAIQKLDAQDRSAVVQHLKDIQDRSSPFKEPERTWVMGYGGQVVGQALGQIRVEKELWQDYKNRWGKWLKEYLSSEKPNS